MQRKKMESMTISSENVKPSFPTPQHLRTYKLSMLDQVSPPMRVPVVLYFPNNATEVTDPNLFISRTTEQLKRSLSVILTRFYPLAGRVNQDGQSIDCNDEGVPFVVVNFSGQKLSDVLRNPDQNLPRWLLPCETKMDPQQGPQSGVAQVRVNYFDCGGIAIGAVFWHRVADAVTIATFLKSWAVAARESKEPVCPNYIFQSMFQQLAETPTRQYNYMADIGKPGKSVMRRFVFDTTAIASLKSKSGLECSTRVQVVSALMWKCFMAAALANNKNSASVATQAVNLRRRAQPPFPSDCFGNFVAWAPVTSSNGNDKELGHLIRKMTDAINYHDDDCINMMRSDGGLPRHLKYMMGKLKEVPKGVHIDVLAITSWCSLGLYGTDFGWGKPIWLTRNDSELPISNEVWLMDTRNGDGIEAWVILDEKYMFVFDNVEELRALASIDPSPLDI